MVFGNSTGKELGLEIQCYEGVTELERIADVFIEQLIQFGISGKKMVLQGPTWSDNNATGNYVAQSGWHTCGSYTEPWTALNTMAGQAAPIGQRVDSTDVNDNLYRWYNEEYTAIVEELGTLPLDDPRVAELTQAALDIYYKEIPAIYTAQAKKLLPFNTKYWTGWPTAANPYVSPPYWSASMIKFMCTIEKAK